MWGGGRGMVFASVWMRGEEEGDKTAGFWDLRTSTAITVVPSLSGVYSCVCVEEGRCWGGGGVCKCVVGEGVGEEEGGQDSLLLGPPHLHGHHCRSQPFWCVLCVYRRGEVCVCGEGVFASVWMEGRKRGDKTARFWDLCASTTIIVIPSPSGVYCVCVEEGRCVCGGGGVFASVWMGGVRGGTRQPASGTSAPPPPSLSSPALLVCTVCVYKRGGVCVGGGGRGGCLQACGWGE